ncbi:CGNR zinc finger domain-containing protein [Streptomyces sp. PR69]|uniref:CGNR zinc finger domain-containing protein n=1 Tax=Streptomyces sp. PR69 TaxID=2984950 RepID=UPI002264CE6B|nr:CGNR zinc finger domain-containing protein [Streptomyces sp. PR69]
MKVSDLASGGAPLFGERPAIELANTAYAVRGRAREGLAGVEQLAAWLRDMRARLVTPLADADLLGVGAQDLAVARALRDGIRALAAAAVRGASAPPEATAAVNAALAAVPSWRELIWGPSGTAPAAPAARVHRAARPVTAALAELADDAVTLFTGPELALLRACEGPGCRLFYVKHHARRAWCSPGCGNRARASRHYARTRLGASPPTRP